MPSVDPQLQITDKYDLYRKIYEAGQHAGMKGYNLFVTWDVLKVVFRIRPKDKYYKYSIPTRKAFIRGYMSQRHAQVLVEGDSRGSEP